MNCKVDQSVGSLWINIILDIGSNDIFGTLCNTSTLVQEGALCLAMGEYGDAAHDGLDGICIHDSISYAWEEEGRLSAFEFIIEVD